MAALHLLLAFAIHRVATRVVIAEAREMIDTIDVHALGLGDGDAGQYTWRQHLVACAQACAWVALLGFRLRRRADVGGRRARRTPRVDPVRVPRRHRHDQDPSLPRRGQVPRRAVPVPAHGHARARRRGRRRQAAANKVLVVAKLAHLCAATWIVVSIVSSVTAIRAEWSAVVIPAAQRPGGAEWKRTVKEAVEAKKKNKEEEEKDEEKFWPPCSPSSPPSPAST